MGIVVICATETSKSKVLKLQLPEFLPLSPRLQTIMASIEDTGSSTPEAQGERKLPTVSFGFTKTISKFKPSSGDSVAKKDDRDYFTGIHGNELQW